ncbi:hypothetical protein [Maridesulfovibrio zosterae]|uniref:hypothetical protein n=1 Tax=Maridesulfovibrio zosterae TaxID=82171 RepID=UPI0003F7D8DB|nr:hypothetical protein [Maridesulfovibrio zosterae]
MRDYTYKLISLGIITLTSAVVFMLNDVGPELKKIFKTSAITALAPAPQNNEQPQPILVSEAPPYSAEAKSNGAAEKTTNNGIGETASTEVKEEQNDSHYEKLGKTQKEPHVPQLSASFGWAELVHLLQNQNGLLVTAIDGNKYAISITGNQLRLNILNSADVAKLSIYSTEPTREIIENLQNANSDIVSHNGEFNEIKIYLTKQFFKNYVLTQQTKALRQAGYNGKITGSNTPLRTNGYFAINNKKLKYVITDVYYGSTHILTNTRK